MSRMYIYICICICACIYLEYSVLQFVYMSMYLATMAGLSGEVHGTDSQQMRIIFPSPGCARTTSYHVFAWRINNKNTWVLVLSTPGDIILLVFTSAVWNHSREQHDCWNVGRVSIKWQLEDQPNLKNYKSTMWK